MAYITTPQVQAEQAVSYGETPDNSLACPIMDRLSKGSCASLHANEPDAYFKTIKFWKTPLAQCDNGESNCVPFQQWVTSWTTDHGLTLGKKRPPRGREKEWWREQAGRARRR